MFFLFLDNQRFTQHPFWSRANMSKIHTNQVSLASNFFSDFNLDKSNRKRDAPNLMNNQKSIHKYNDSANNDSKQSELLSFNTNSKKASFGSRILLSSNDRNRAKITENKSAAFTFSSAPSGIVDKPFFAVFSHVQNKRGIADI